MNAGRAILVAIAVAALLIVVSGWGLTEILDTLTGMQAYAGILVFILIIALTVWGYMRVMSRGPDTS